MQFREVAHRACERDARMSVYIPLETSIRGLLLPEIAGKPGDRFYVMMQRMALGRRQDRTTRDSLRIA